MKLESSREEAREGEKGRVKKGGNGKEDEEEKGEGVWGSEVRWRYTKELQGKKQRLKPVSNCN